MTLKLGNNDDWNNLWRKKPRDLLERLDNPLNWEDIIWKSILEMWENKLTSKLDTLESLEFLECGCGAATFSRYFNKNYNVKTSVLDKSSESINIAKEYFKKDQLNALFYNDDLKKLPFADNSFDLVYSGGVIEYFSDYESIIQEMTRVLKKDGIFIANISPRKFSSQTIGDIQMTIASSLFNIFKLNFKEAFKKIKMIPDSYSINNATLKDYEKILNKLNYKYFECRCINPYPNLFLPKVIKNFYISYLKRNLKNIKKFNESNSKVNKIFGISYSIYAIK